MGGRVGGGRLVYFSAIWFGLTVYAAADTVHPESARATRPGRVTGVGRSGAVLGPRLVGALADSGHDDRGFTAFALAGIRGAIAITLVPLARRAAHGATTDSRTPTTTPANRPLPESDGRNQDRACAVQAAATCAPVSGGTARRAGALRGGRPCPAAVWRGRAAVTP
ncbi:hypothetical protein ACFXDH_22725 [Streptomyces sp. NPDC059467]|uniref:hypothetical protein n=1 Tax=Streptomyces sp. NPDC059467 TaxID=3346844 RepID=UPI003677CDAA